jgi:hypothetical protein
LTKKYKAMTDKLKKGTVNIGKYKVGLPGSNSYNSKTPKTIKTISETLILIGTGVSIIAVSFTLPPVVIVAGSLAALFGRYGLKCFSE